MSRRSVNVGRINMTKPIARLIHNLSRAGGTLIGKCVGSMETVVLLSEINHRGRDRFNPIDQAHRWFDLVSEDDIAALGDPREAAMADMIGLIEQRATAGGSRLVIRD